jgi:hypothetical protein
MTASELTTGSTKLGPGRPEHLCLPNGIAPVGDLAGFELLPGIYGGGAEERMRALLDERL